MISFRSHVLTIIAVFAALAVGVVLGGGPLADVGDDVRATSATEEPADADSSAAVTYGDAYASALAPGLLQGRLDGRSVAVVTMPGADETEVTALSEEVALAGGAVSGVFRIAPALLEVGEKSLVDTLGSQLVAQDAEAADAEASTYVRMGQLIGQSVSSGVEEPRPASPKNRAVREALVGAGLLELPAEEADRAPLVLVVLGTAPSADAAPISAGVLEGLTSRTVGMVVAGDTSDGAGQLAALRAEAGLATAASVDGIDTAAGRTTTVLALARAISTDGGSFGATGSDGPVPLG